MRGPSDRRTFLQSSAVAAGAALAPWGAAPPAAGRGEYTLDDGLTYLNHGSMGTVPRVVQEAYAEHVRTCERNPWLYMYGGAWEEAVAGVRARAGAWLGCPAADVALLRSTTEAFNLLAHGLPLEPGDEVLFSNLNHVGASECWRNVAAAKGIAVRTFELPLAEAPATTAERLVEQHVAALRDETRVLVLPHADNLIGLRQPVAAIAAAARARGVEFVLADGAQAVGAFPVAVGELGVDAYATSAHKWTQAPKGNGLLWTRPALRAVLRPMIVTWGQRRWAGTVRVLEDLGSRNLPCTLALGDAIAFQTRLGIEQTTARRARLFAAFRERVDAEPGLSWRSPREFAMGASLFAVGVDGADTEELARRLYAEHRVVVRGFGDGSIRVSPNAANTDGDADALIAALRALRPR